MAKHIVRAIEKRKDVAYVPPFWGLIMLVVRNIPRRFSRNEYVAEASLVVARICIGYCCVNIYSVN